MLDQPRCAEECSSRAGPISYLSPALARLIYRRSARIDSPLLDHASLPGRTPQGRTGAQHLGIRPEPLASIYYRDDELSSGRIRRGKWQIRLTISTAPGRPWL